MCSSVSKNGENQNEGNKWNKERINLMLKSKLVY